MSVSRDTSKGTWTVYARYTDWQGKVKVLHKRGFKAKRDALQYEREYLLKKAKDVNMGFAQFVECYLEDLKPRLKYNTYLTKEHINLHRDNIALALNLFAGDNSVHQIPGPLVSNLHNNLLIIERV